MSVAQDYYPGSRRTRRDAPQPVIVPGGWDDAPVLKTLPNGVVAEMFTLGALAGALGRPLVTVRFWERKGYIPKAPYRFREAVVGGKRVPGRRLYTRALIVEAVAAFTRHRLIGMARIDWNANNALSIELTEAWKRIHETETANS